jgi:hypothetical protein
LFALENQPSQRLAQLGIQQHLLLGGEDAGQVLAQLRGCLDTSLGKRFGSMINYFEEPLPLGVAFVGSDAAPGDTIPFSVQHPGWTDRDSRRNWNPLQFKHASNEAIRPG